MVESMRQNPGAIYRSFVLALLFALLGSPSALAASSSLTGELLVEFWSPGLADTHVTATCDPAGVSTITYSSSGSATGPYPGTYSEQGTITIGPQTGPSFGSDQGPAFGTSGSRNEATGPMLSAVVEFQISSDQGTVTGTKTYTGSTHSYGVCRNYDNEPLPSGLSGGVGTGYLFVVYGTLDYAATIVSGSNTTVDEGTSLLYVEELRVSRSTGGGAENGQFQEGFTSTLVRPPASLTLTPPDAVNNVGTDHTVTATVRDSSGNPLSDVVVRFTVSGSSSTSGSCTTATSGECTFTYSGPVLPGADIISAYADSNANGTADPGEPSGEATKAWVLPASTAGQTTGGGQVWNSTATDKIAFGYNAQNAGGNLKGNCEVVDPTPATNVKIKCLDVTALVLSGTHATFFGNAIVNGSATTYRIDVDDFGEPGANLDTFKIVTSNGYAMGGTITNGNIQVRN